MFRGQELVVLTAREITGWLQHHPNSIGAILMEDRVDDLERLVIDLLDRGCTYYACCGTASEMVHDLIDDILVARGGNAVTTWHEEDEPLEEVANLFLAGGLAREDASVVLALLAPESQLEGPLLAHPQVVPCSTTP